MKVSFKIYFIRFLLKKQLPETAVYWCNQASSLSQGQEEDVLRLAESLTNAKQYHRAAHLLKTSNLQTKSWKGCFLAVNALFLAKNVDEAAKILEATENLVEKSAIEKAKKEENCPNIEVCIFLKDCKCSEFLHNALFFSGWSPS